VRAREAIWAACARRTRSFGREARRLGDGTRQILNQVDVILQGTSPKLDLDRPQE